MLKKVILNKDVMPFSITISFDSFQKEYLNFKRNKNLNSLNIVYQELLSQFLIWQNKLLNKDYYTDITIYTLLRILEADSKTPGTLTNKLQLLFEYLNFFEISFLDICTEAFLLHMNKTSYLPMYKYSKQKDLFYYIAKEVKMFIFSLIRKCINYQYKTNLLQSSLTSLTNFSSYEIDTNFISTSDIPLNSLKYLIDLSLSNSNPTKNNPNFKNLNLDFEKEYLCNLIKTQLSNN